MRFFVQRIINNILFSWAYAHPTGCSLPYSLEITWQANILLKIKVQRHNGSPIFYNYLF